MTQRLLGMVVRAWPEFHGAMLISGVRPLELPLPWLLDVIYAWAIDGVAEKDRIAFDARLNEPPDGVDISEDDPVWGDDALLEQFMSSSRR